MHHKKALIFISALLISSSSHAGFRDTLRDIKDGVKDALGLKTPSKTEMEGAKNSINAIIASYDTMMRQNQSVNLESSKRLEAFLKAKKENAKKIADIIYQLSLDSKKALERIDRELEELKKQKDTMSPKEAQEQQAQGMMMQGFWMAMAPVTALYNATANAVAHGWDATKGFFNLETREKAKQKLEEALANLEKAIKDGKNDIQSIRTFMTDPSHRDAVKGHPELSEGIKKIDQLNQEIAEVKKGLDEYWKTLQDQSNKAVHLKDIKGVDTEIKNLGDAVAKNCGMTSWVDALKLTTQTDASGKERYGYAPSDAFKKCYDKAK